MYLKYFIHIYNYIDYIINTYILIKKNERDEV